MVVKSENSQSRNSLLEAIKRRKSIRDFKSIQIPQTILREIIETACRAPSAMNTQPWEFTVITKEVLDSVINSVIEKFRAGEKPHSEHSVTGWSMDSVYRQRQVELAKNIFQLMHIKREDADKRQIRFDMLEERQPSTARNVILIILRATKREL